MPYIRAELALKLEGFLNKKGKENESNAARQSIERRQAEQLNNFVNQGCQNSDNLDLDSSINDDPEEETTKEQSRNNYAHANRDKWLEEEHCKKLPAINPIKPIDTKRELAQITGVSHDTIERVKTIQGKAPEDVLQKVKTGEISINQAYTTIKRQENEEKRNDEVKENTEKVSQAKSIDELEGLFKTIVIDPPWDWGDSGCQNSQ